MNHLADHLTMIEQWLMYSEDKRTGGGWYFMQAGNEWETGRVGPTGLVDKTKYLSAVEACAAYVLMELDFWSSLE